WTAALRQAPRMHAPFDGVWWAGLLARRAESTGREGPPAHEQEVDEASARATSERRQDWGEAPDVIGFVGRAEELATLREWVLEPGQPEGRYRDGYAGYGRLLQAIGEGRHQSCLMVTSREAPRELATLAGNPVRTLELGGLAVAEGQVLLANKQLSGNDNDWANLTARFGGNGLALKLVGESIRQVFGGEIGSFLEGSGSNTVFGGIRRLLAEQFERSSALEKKVLRVLAVQREPVKIAELISDLGPRGGRGE